MKYHSHKIKTQEGLVFDSKKEYRRWLELIDLSATGRIKNLQRQIRYQLIPSQHHNGKVIERPVYYIADFVYEQDGDTVVEDTKGFKTSEYIIKRKLMLYLHNIRIKEI